MWTGPAAELLLPLAAARARLEPSAASPSAELLFLPAPPSEESPLAANCSASPVPAASPLPP